MTGGVGRVLPDSWSRASDRTMGGSASMPWATK
jgi:hypothetical protein